MLDLVKNNMIEKTKDIRETLKVKLINNIKELQTEAKKDTDTYYLINENENLSDFILKSELDDDILMNLKIAYNIKFNGYIKNINEKSKIHIHSIKDVINKLNNENCSNQRLIIDFNSEDKALTSEQKKILTNLIQQFIFLNLNKLEIITEAELRNKKLFKNFKDNLSNLKSNLKDFKFNISNYQTNDKKINNYKKELIKKIDNIEKISTQVNDRKIIISIVGLRNSGKSVVVNSFIGQEFAPTSSQDSTPNAVFYETWDKEYIEMKIEQDDNLDKYKKEILLKFDKAEEVYEYLKDEFENTNKSAEKYMPNIYIKYPGNMEYIIIDTPGPNKGVETEDINKEYSLAHQNIAKDCIEKSDAIIMTIKYGDNEEKNAVEFLKEISDTLIEKDKLHSLLIVANKLDEMYIDKLPKSPVSYIDKSIQYLNDSYKDMPIVMIPASALEYFNIIEYHKIIKNKNKNFDKVLMDDLIKEFNPKELNSDEKTIRAFIKNRTSDIEDFHYIEDPTIDDIINHSNMRKVIERTEYISKNKVFEEIFSNLFYNFNKEFTSIENDFLGKEIQKLQNQKQDILDDLNKINEFFEDKKKEIKESNNKLDEKKKDVVNEIDNLFNELSLEFKAQLEAELYAIKLDISEEKENKIEIDKIINKDLNQRLNRDFTSTINGVNNIKNNYITALEYQVINLNNQIQEEIKEKEFNKKYNLDIKLTELSPKLQKEKFSLDNSSFYEGLTIFTGMSYALNNITKKVHATERKKRLIEFNFFEPSIYEEYDEKLYTEKEVIVEKGWFWDTTKTVRTAVMIEEIDKNKLDKQVKEIEKKLLTNISINIESHRSSTKKQINEQLDQFKEDIDNELYKVIADYTKTNANIKNLLNSDKTDIENSEKFFNSMDEELELVRKVINKIKEV